MFWVLNNKNKFSVASLIISFGSITYLIVLNYKLAQRYIAASGKTRALFGLNELGWLEYKFYLAPFIILSLILWIVSFRKKEWKTLSIIAAVASIVSFLLLFIRFWKWML